MGLLLLYVSLALGVSFLCSVLEAVVLSITPSFVAKMEAERPKLGKQLKEMKGDVDRPLAGILTLNTIAHTMGAAGAGAEAENVFGDKWLAVFSAVLTVLILVLSEIIPKTIGATYWRRLTPFAVRTLRLILMPPFGWLVSATQLITKLLKRGAHGHGGAVSKEEFKALTNLAREQGVFDESESRILKNIFVFGQLRTRDVMTPRTVMFALPSTRRVGDVVPKRGEPEADTTAKQSTMVFSRIPVYGATPDDVIGYVLKDDLFLKAARDEFDCTVGELVREMLVVPESLQVATLFERLLDRREHIALVVDEYGGVDGVVTMEDVLETLLGMEIVDEADTEVDLREIARSRWRARAVRMGLDTGEEKPKDQDDGEEGEGDAAAEEAPEPA